MNVITNVQRRMGREVYLLNLTFFLWPFQVWDSISKSVNMFFAYEIYPLYRFSLWYLMLKRKEQNVLSERRYYELLQVPLKKFIRYKTHCTAPKNISFVWWRYSAFEKNMDGLFWYKNDKLYIKQCYFRCVCIS